MYGYLCQYNPKGVQLSGFGGKFTCSRAWADPEINVWGRGVDPSLTDVLVVLYLLFSECFN